MRKFLFLDLDGVLNPFRSASPPAYFKAYWEKITIPNSSYKVWVNPTLGRQLTQTCAELGVELVWATTWVDNPPNLEFYASRCTLPANLARISQTEEFLFDQTTCGKRPGVEGFLRPHPDAAMFWLDDNLGSHDLAWVASRATRSPSAASLVDPALGLTAEHLESCTAFFSGLA